MESLFAKLKNIIETTFVGKMTTTQRRKPKDGVVPIKEHIKLLLEGEAHDTPCDDCEMSEVDFGLPKWFDPIKYARGQKYIQSNMFAQSIITVCGLVTILAVPSILTILKNSHRSSTMIGAYRRYLSTVLHLNSWYYQELKPGTKAWRSLVTVRERHIKSTAISKKRGDGHISQRDIVIGQFGFVGIGLIRSKFLSMDTTNREDVEGYVHFWRVICYMIGVEDKYNLCRPSLEETKEVANVILSEIFQPFLQNPPEYFYFMVDVFFKGMWYLNPTISEGHFLYMTYRLMGLEGFHYSDEEREQAKEEKFKAERRRKTYEITNELRNLDYPGKDQHKLVSGDEFYEKLGWSNRLSLFIIMFLFKHVYVTTLGRLFLNYRIRFAYFMSENFPYICFWRFGIKYAYVNMFDEDVRVIADVKTNKEMLVYQKY